MTFVFVGEKRSRRAMQMGVYWSDGRLAAKTLHEALRAAGYEPQAHIYCNLYQDGEGWVLQTKSRDELRRHLQQGHVIVGLGKRVQKQLSEWHVPHVALIHPAARGAIRARERYHAHVAGVLAAPAEITEEAA